MSELTIKPVSLFDKKPVLFNIAASSVEDHKPIGLNNYSLEFVVPPTHRQFTHYEFHLRIAFNIEKADGTPIGPDAKVAVESNITGALFSSFTCKLNNTVIQSDQAYWLKHYLLTLFRNNKTVKEGYLRAANLWFPDDTNFTDGTVCKRVVCNLFAFFSLFQIHRFTATNSGYVFRRNATELSRVLTVFDKIELDCSSGKRFFLPGLVFKRSIRS